MGRARRRSDDTWLKIAHKPLLPKQLQRASLRNNLSDLSPELTDASTLVANWFWRVRNTRSRIARARADLRHRADRPCVSLDGLPLPTSKPTVDRNLRNFGLPIILGDQCVRPFRRLLTKSNRLFKRFCKRQADHRC